VKGVYRKAIIFYVVHRDCVVYILSCAVLQHLPAPMLINISADQYVHTDDIDNVNCDNVELIL